MEPGRCGVLTDYSKFPPDGRNILRLMFDQCRIRATQHGWDSVARFVVSAFRADAARAGAMSEVGELVDELCRMSPEFAALRRENNAGAHGGGTKRLRHPMLGTLELEYSSFAVEERPGLGMLVYNPVSSADAALIRALITGQASAA
jgi:hypothetical protein